VEYTPREKVEETLIYLADAHLEPSVRPSRAYLAAKRFTFSIQPNYLVFGGDFGHWRSLCHHEKNKPLLRENQRYSRDIAICKEELEDFRDMLPDTEMYFLEGNHELWAEKFIEQEAATLEGTINLRKDLELDRLNIKWFKYNEILKIGKMAYTHGWDHTKYYAMRTLEAFADNIMVAHAHRPQYFIQQKGSPIHPQPYCCVGVGCLCDMNPHYLRNKRATWAHGLGMVEYRKNGEFQPHHINIIDGKLTFGGWTWDVREKSFV